MSEGDGKRTMGVACPGSEPSGMSGTACAGTKVGGLAAARSRVTSRGFSEESLRSMEGGTGMFRGVTCGLGGGVAGVEAGRGEPRPYEGNLCWRESGISVRDKKHMRRLTS